MLEAAEALDENDDLGLLAGAGGGDEDDAEAKAGGGGGSPATAEAQKVRMYAGSQNYSYLTDL